MPVEIKKIPGGFLVDGLELKSGKCGCTSFASCCYTWSKVKKRDGGFAFTAKTATPDTSENYEWGYTVQRDGVTVSVDVQDARDKEIYSGFLPPAVSAWQDKGWEVLETMGHREDGSVYRCGMSKWLYVESGDKPAFNELPDDWKCLKCGSPRSGFEDIG